MRKMPEKPKRIVLKISGEALMGKQGFGISPEVNSSIAEQVKELHDEGCEIAIVIGGGNIFRGLKAASKGMDRSTADYMGMLATMLNGMALQDALEKTGVFTRVMSAIEMPELAELYIRRRAVRHLEKKRVVIFVCGTGNPYFTTDTAAALRATEIGADLIMKATKVDGVYSTDPEKDQGAEKYQELDYMTVLKEKLKVMDATAISLCMDNDLPIIVFSIREDGNIKRVWEGQRVGTLIS